MPVVSEQVRYLTKEMQRVQAQEGRPLEDALRDLYVEQEFLLAEIGRRWGLGESAVARWLQYFGIPARKGGPVRERVA